MTVDNESAKRLFAAFASASLLKAEHRECAAKLWALIIQSEQIKAELREWKPTTLAPNLSLSANPSNRLQLAWLGIDRR